MTTIELRGLSKIYTEGEVPFDAVRDIDLSIADGEFFTVIGPSGCGKSTLLRLVAGLDQPTSGKVLLDGQVVNDVPANQRDLAMVFQSSALYASMTVAENIGFPLLLAKVARHVIDQRVRETAELLEIADLLDRRPNQISGGQRQRVSLGRMLIRQPRIFLMDEPMSNIDTKLRGEMRVEIMRIQQRLGTTTLYVTHDHVEAMGMGHRLAVMRRGRIVQLGDPDTMYTFPFDLFVGQFLGSPPMNAWLATVENIDGRVTMSWGTSQLALDHACRQRFGGFGSTGRHDVIVGLRPEAFVSDVDGELILTPVWAEHLGPSQLVHCLMSAAGVNATSDRLEVSNDHVMPIVVALDSAVTFSVWEPLRLSIDLGQLHLFDATTGASLTTRPACAMASPLV